MHWTNICEIPTTYRTLNAKTTENTWTQPWPKRWGWGKRVRICLTHPEINKQYNFYTRGLLPTSNLCRKERGCPLKEKKVSRSKASLITVSFKLKGLQKGGQGTNVGNKSLPLLSEGQSLNGRVPGIYAAHLLRNGCGEEISAGALIVWGLAFPF